MATHAMIIDTDRPGWVVQRTQRIRFIDGKFSYRKIGSFQCKYKCEEGTVEQWGQTHKNRCHIEVIRFRHRHPKLFSLLFDQLDFVYFLPSILVSELC